MDCEIVVQEVSELKFDIWVICGFPYSFVLLFSGLCHSTCCLFSIINGSWGAIGWILVSYDEMMYLCKASLPKI